MFKIMVLMLAVSIMPRAMASSCRDKVVCQIAGDWQGSGYNVHLGAYEATWSATYNPHDRFSLIEGTLEVISKDEPSLSFLYQLQISRHRHPLNSSDHNVFVYGIRVSDASNHTTDYFAASTVTDHLLSGWKTEPTNLGTGTFLLSRAFEITLVDGNLTFAQVFSEGRSSSGALYSGSYSPVILQKISD